MAASIPKGKNPNEVDGKSGLSEAKVIFRDE